MSKDIAKYKQTEVGEIPVAWVIKKIVQCAEILDNHRKPLNQAERMLMKGNIPYYGANGIVDFINEYLLDEDLILIAEDGGYFDEYQTRPIAYKIKGKSWVNNHAHILRVKSELVQDFVFYSLEHKNILPWLNGGTRAKLNKGELEKITIAVPSFSEQKQIAKILNIWDNGINKTKEIIAELKQRKKGLAQEILLGKIRFSETQNSPLVKNKGYVIPKDWKVAPISKLVKQVKKSVIPEPDTLYSQIGIRSHAKGIFYKEAVTGLSLGNKSVFEIEPDCFIVNIVFAWEHAIAKTTINEAGMIASHRFPMYKPLENELDLNYLLHFFKSKKGKELLGIASPGGAGRNKTLGQSEFLKLQIPVPTLTEQNKIAEFLDKIDAEIIVHHQKLAHLQNQKKGLMQQLLTGKTRVKLND